MRAKSEVTIGEIKCAQPSSAHAVNLRRCAVRGEFRDAVETERAGEKQSSVAVKAFSLGRVNLSAPDTKTLFSCEGIRSARRAAEGYDDWRKNTGHRSAYGSQLRQPQRESRRNWNSACGYGCVDGGAGGWWLGDVRWQG